MHAHAHLIAPAHMHAHVPTHVILDVVIDFLVQQHDSHPSINVAQVIRLRGHSATEAGYVP